MLIPLQISQALHTIKLASSGLKYVTRFFLLQVLDMTKSKTL